MPTKTDCMPCEWGVAPMTIGSVYKFPKPVQAKSIAIASKNQSKRIENPEKVRTFGFGKLIEVTEKEEKVFTGHKIPSPGAKKVKTKYRFIVK